MITVDLVVIRYWPIIYIDRELQTRVHNNSIGRNCMNLVTKATFNSDSSNTRTITYHVTPPTIQTILFLLTVVWVIDVGLRIRVLELSCAPALEFPSAFCLKLI